MKTNIETALYLLSISPNNEMRECGERAAKEYAELRYFADSMLSLVDLWNATGWMDDAKANILVDEFRGLK